MIDAMHGVKTHILAALNSPGLSLVGSGFTAGTAYIAEATGKSAPWVSDFTLMCAAVTGGCIALFWIQKITVYSYFNLVRFLRWWRGGFKPVRLRDHADGEAPGADDIPGK